MSHNILITGGSGYLGGSREYSFRLLNFNVLPNHLQSSLAK